MTEEELLANLDAHKAHADELADTLPHELTPLERLKGSVKRYDRPTDPVWDNYFNPNEGVGSSLHTLTVELGLDSRIYHNPATFIATVRAGISGHVLKQALEHFDSKQIFARALSTNVAGLEAYCGETPLDRQRSEVVLATVGGHQNQARWLEQHLRKVALMTTFRSLRCRTPKHHLPDRLISGVISQAHEHSRAASHGNAGSPALPVRARARTRGSGRGKSGGRVRESQRNPPCDWRPS